MTARLFTLDPVEGFRPKTFAGHRDAVLGAYFSVDGKTVRLLYNNQAYIHSIHCVDLHRQP